MTPEAAPRTAARQQLLSDLVEACQSRKPLLPVLLKHGVFREAEAAQPATPVGALDVERCQYRAGWCEKEAGHEGSHYTTYRDGETWTLPADALEVDVVVERREAKDTVLGGYLSTVLSTDTWESLLQVELDETQNEVIAAFAAASEPAGGGEGS